MSLYIWNEQKQTMQNGNKHIETRKSKCVLVWHN